MNESIVDVEAIRMTVYFTDNERGFVRPTSSRWTVMITGAPEVLDALARSSSSTEYDIVRVGAEFYLHSSAFDSVSEETEVEAICRRILDSVNGALFLSTGMPSTIRLRNITLHLGGNKYAQTGFPQNVEIIRHQPKKDLVDAVGTSVSVWSDLAAHDADVATVLRFLTTGHLDWPTLYKILEVIRDDIGGNSRLVSRGWMTKAKLTAFTRSANDPSISGDSARHARFNSQPLKRPMSRGDGELLIRKLTQAWIASKAKRKPETPIQD